MSACQKCFEEHTKCSAHNRQNRPCGRQPMKFQTVCDLHGGKASHALQAAKRREVESYMSQHYPADPNAILAHEGIEPIEDPILELGQLATSAKALMANLGKRINFLESHEATWTDKAGQEQINGQILLFERAMDRTAKLLKMLTDVGFEARRTELDEKVAAQFSLVMANVFARLNLTPEQSAISRTAVFEELKALETGPAPA